LPKFREYLYDDIGNEYKRKNLYLSELALLETRITEASGTLKKELKAQRQDIVLNRHKHPYNIQFLEFLQKEKLFLDMLRSRSKNFKQEVDLLPSRLKTLKTKLFISQQRHNFYKAYTHLCYDAEFAFNEARIYLDSLPEITDSFQEDYHILQNALVDRKNINLHDDKQKRTELAKFKQEQRVAIKEGKIRLRDKRRQGLISSKAEKNGIAELKNKFKELVNIKAFEAPRKANSELIKKKRFDLTNGTKRKLNVVQANIADLRRITPSETTKSKPILAYTTFLLPGLGQILNKQLEKGLIFLLVSFFSYFVAIPYALGYGNYQGEGVAGLISLAEGAPRIHQSLIYMIEGIIAIFLVIIALALFYVSFRDVLKVESEKIIGIRPRNWHETKTNISVDGFPYIVSLPALLVIVFIVLVPVVTTILISFTGMSPKMQSRFSWVGIQNYRMLILGEGLAGSAFWLILYWTVIWTIAASTLAIIVGFVLALLANNERVIGKKFFRTVYLLPWAVPAFITIMFFSIMFSPNGILTEILQGIFGGRIHVKTDPQLTRLVLILMQGWLGSAYVFLLTTGVLQAIPQDLYEAADIDGATDWQKTRRITIPIVLFQIAPLLITQYTFNFNNFSIIWLFNGGGPFHPTKYGNLAGSSDILISYIYKLTMINQQQAIGAAITIFISIGLLAFAYVGFKNSKAFKEGKL